MAVTVTALSTISMGSDSFASGERSQEENNQKSAAKSFERFHKYIRLRVLSGCAR
ncbi:MAG TPA: hypothetical protein PKX42_01740 [Polaromonas sp.]|nr:hypothetical protein [Polaromonas sp.]